MRCGTADLGHRDHKPPKLKNFGLRFCIQDLEWCHNMGPRKVPPDSLLLIQHQGQFTVVAPFEVPGGTIQGTWWHHSRSLVAPFEVPCCGTIRGPGYKISDHNFSVSVVYRLL